MSETPFEGPVEDVVEQRADVLPDDQDDQDDRDEQDGRERRAQRGRWSGSGWDADPADAQEQDAEVPFDEDEWR